MKNQGFTLIEITIVMTITILLLTFTTINLINFQQNTYVDTTVEQVVSDIKYQQISAMNGAAEGENSAQQFGIHFETNSYTLFHGNSFDPLEPANFTIAVDTGVSFSSVTFPQNEMLFEKGSGEIVGFVEGSNTITIQDATNTNQTVITMNKLGTITQIQQTP